jgi:predicted AAA+ superfamily ATPase
MRISSSSLTRFNASRIIFRLLRGLIDEGRRRGRGTGRFLVLGSASMDLLRQSSESLAGRIRYMELMPLHAGEIEPGNCPPSGCAAGSP